MVGIVECGGHGGEEKQHDSREGRRHCSHGDEGGGIDAQGGFFGFVDEAEESRFHAEGEQHQQQGGVAVYLRDDAVSA